MWSFLDLRPAKLRPKMHLSAFTDSEVEDKQILNIKSEQMLPKVPKVTNKSGTLGSICSLLIWRIILHIKSEQMLPKVPDLFVTFGTLGSICSLLIFRICLFSTSESVNADRCIFGLNFAGLRSRKLHIESELC